MALTNDQITAQNFKDFYMAIRPYLCNSAHGGFTPIGTVISVMGKQAPHNYLVCDGTVYNIADYPELAAYFTGQFEASNFFGGDGITTFAVPDLRGEFLRGTGTNSHAHGGAGANVGEHQEGTAHLYIGKNAHSNSEQRLWFQSNLPDDEANTNVPKNIDGIFENGATLGSSWKMDGGTFDASGVTHYYSRPTNTSVLYCIATKNIFMDAGHNYSTDEQVVGTWIDGKPIYQRTFVLLNYSDNDNTRHHVTIADLSSINIDHVTNISGFLECQIMKLPISAPVNVQNDQFYYVQVSSINQTDLCLFLTCQHCWWSGTSDTVDVYATIQYTKTTD